LTEPSAEAFAPAAISNFFSVYDKGLSSDTPDLSHVGATGGGFMLSRGVRSTARLLPGGSGRLRVKVNGDPLYKATTTRKAVELLLGATGLTESTIDLVQTVEVPIGRGFGASAASALSGVNAVASLLGINMSRARIAYFAHAADILCRTGLGTVSVIYRYGGAGVIVKPGGPGVAAIERVPVPDGTKVVTASLAAYEKGVILSSTAMKKKVNRLGREALERCSDLTLESLVRAGEVFADGLGLESPELVRLLKLARSNGAMGASQNMVGHAIHAVVAQEDAARVVAALVSDPSSPTIGVYGFGEGPSG
jgi:pantoate kinase